MTPIGISNALCWGQDGSDEQTSIAQPNVHALAGARNAEQAQANAQAAQVQLSPAELDEIDAIGRQVSDHLEGTPIMWDFAA